MSDEADDLPWCAAVETEKHPPLDQTVHVRVSVHYVTRCAILSESLSLSAAQSPPL